MSNEPTYNFVINAETDRFFHDSSLTRGQPPRIVILMGGPASGKTTVRKQRSSTGCVLVDAGEIFLNLSRGDDSISAYYAEPFQRRWLHEAACAPVTSRCNTAHTGTR